MDFKNYFEISLSIYFVFVGLSRMTLYLVSKRFHKAKNDDLLKFFGYILAVISGLCYCSSEIIHLLDFNSVLVAVSIFMIAYLINVISIGVQIMHSLKAFTYKAQFSNFIANHVKIINRIMVVSVSLQALAVIGFVFLSSFAIDFELAGTVISSLFNIVNAICMMFEITMIMNAAQEGFMSQSKTSAKFQKVIRKLKFTRISTVFPLIFDFIRIVLAFSSASLGDNKFILKYFSIFSLVFGSAIFNSYFGLSQSTLDKIFSSSDFQKIKIDRSAKNMKGTANVCTSSKDLKSLSSKDIKTMSSKDIKTLSSKDLKTANSTTANSAGSANEVMQVRINFADESVNWLGNGIPSMTEFVSWPNPINEKDSEIVQVLSVLILIGSIYEYDKMGTVIGFSYLAYAFLVRLIAGPKIEPLHQLVIRYFRPSLEKLHIIESHYIPYYPKRFATLVGAAMAIMVFLLALLGLRTATFVVSWMWAILMMAAGFDGLCMACAIFWLMVQLKLLPDEVCNCKFIYEIN